MKRGGCIGGEQTWCSACQWAVLGLEVSGWGRKLERRLTGDSYEDLVFILGRRLITARGLESVYLELKVVMF